MFFYIARGKKIQRLLAEMWFMDDFVVMAFQIT